MMSDEIQSEVLSQVAEIVEPIAVEPELTCWIHSDAEAEISCADCGRPMCETCLTESAKGPHFICPACRKRHVAKQSILGSLKLARFPAFWVLICIAISGVAYAMGVGNPHPDEMAKWDAKRPWFVHQAPKLFLDQGSRERQRADALRRLDEPAAARRWSLMASKAFAEAAERWQGSPVVMDLRIAEGDMLGGAGQYRRAYDLLKQLEETAAADSKTEYPALIGYYLATVSERAGWKDMAKRYYQATLKLAEANQKSFIDRMIDNLSGNRKAAEFKVKVRIVCGTDMTAADIVAKCREALGMKEDVVNPLGCFQEPDLPEGMEIERRVAPEPQFEIEYGED